MKTAQNQEGNAIIFVILAISLLANIGLGYFAFTLKNQPPSPQPSSTTPTQNLSIPKATSSPTKSSSSNSTQNPFDTTNTYQNPFENADNPFNNLQ